MMTNGCNPTVGWWDMGSCRRFELPGNLWTEPFELAGDFNRVVGDYFWRIISH
jgi:hypothetical protein